MTRQAGPGTATSASAIRQPAFGACNVSVTEAVAHSTSAPASFRLEPRMARSISRKDLLLLSISITALGVVGGCGDDDDDAVPGGAGKSSQAGASGSGTSSAGSTHNGGGGHAGSNSGGSGNGGGAENGAGDAAGAPEGGGASQGGAGGDTTTSSGGEGGTDNRVGSAGEPAAGTGGGGTGGGATGPQCQGVTMTQTATTGNGHSHITADGQLNLKLWINSGHPTAEFELPATDHTHVIQLTIDQVDTLRGGGTVTGILSSESQAHTHTFMIACA